MKTLQDFINTENNLNESALGLGLLSLMGIQSASLIIWYYFDYYFNNEYGYRYIEV